MPLIHWQLIGEYTRARRGFCLSTEQFSSLINSRRLLHKTHSM